MYNSTCGRGRRGRSLREARARPVREALTSTSMDPSRNDPDLRVLIDGPGMPEHRRDSLRDAVRAALASHPGGDALSIVLTRLHSGEWTVFITDGTHLELMDGALSARIVEAVKSTEKRLRDRVLEADRRLLRAIAARHRDDPRAMVPLLDLALQEAGSEPAARTALQRLVLQGLVELAPDAEGPLRGRLSEAGESAAALA